MTKIWPWTAPLDEEAWGMLEHGVRYRLEDAERKQAMTQKIVSDLHEQLRFHERELSERKAKIERYEGILEQLATGEVRRCKVDESG